MACRAREGLPLQGKLLTLHSFLLPIPTTVSWLKGRT